MAVPHTWTTGELATASLLNGIRDALIALAAAKPLVMSFGDPGGAVLTTGVKRTIFVKNGIRVTGWTLAADAVGSVVIDLWVAAYPTIPTVANTITGTEKPTLAAVRVNQDSALTSWSTDIPSGSFLVANIDSAATIKQLTLSLDGTLLELL
jgi:hypothetical protein